MLEETGNYSEAITIAVKILEDREKTLGADNPAVADSCTRLAALYFQTRGVWQGHSPRRAALSMKGEVLGLRVRIRSGHELPGNHAYVGLSNYPKAQEL